MWEMLLNECGTGWLVGNALINHLMYADDLVILCPCSSGLQQLFRICSQYGIDFDIKYNVKKMNIMVVRSREDRKFVFTDFFPSDIWHWQVCNVAKYLGHYITDDLSDDRDIYRQCRKLHAQANTLAVWMAVWCYFSLNHLWTELCQVLV